MSSRMDKYYDDEPIEVGSRTKKNQTLYRNMSKESIDNVNISSNAHVIGDNDANIDIDKIRELLEKKYRKEPKRNRLYEEKEELLEAIEPEKEETKEYDINAIIEKARLDKDVDYERERLKKIRDTQYDILKGLNLDGDKEEKSNSKEDDLMSLINTITEKEKTRDMNPLDILTDLKGSDHTAVLDGVKKELDELHKTEQLNQKDIRDTVKEEVKKEIDKTFYTNSLSFTKSDFDDFNDLKEDIASNKMLIRILLVIVAIALFIGILFLVNHVFNLNWF